MMENFRKMLWKTVMIWRSQTDLLKRWSSLRVHIRDFLYLWRVL